jgi:uncharacterized metal-binding protein
MANSQPSCGCSAKAVASGENLIFSCSGAADVGEIADHVGRQVNKSGAAKMYCLVGVGANIPAIVQRTRNAAKVVAIDGGEMDCARLCLANAGIPAAHVRITDLGLPKGKSPANDKNVALVAEKVAKLLT